MYILVDQWQASATGYSSNKNVITPNLDRLASESVNLKNAVSGMPICNPHRVSSMTGQHPLTIGIFMNDVLLDTNAVMWQTLKELNINDNTIIVFSSNHNDLLGAHGINSGFGICKKMELFN